MGVKRLTTFMMNTGGCSEEREWVPTPPVNSSSSSEHEAAVDAMAGLNLAASQGTLAELQQRLESANSRLLTQTAGTDNHTATVEEVETLKAEMAAKTLLSPPRFVVDMYAFLITIFQEATDDAPQSPQGWHFGGGYKAYTAEVKRRLLALMAVAANPTEASPRSIVS